MFPIEIWELIFQYTDPVILLKYQYVCKSWNEAIKRIFKETDIWHRKCCRDIPRYLWSSLLEKLYPNINCINLYESKMDSKIWMTMYCSWIKWHKLVKHTPSIECLEPISKRRLLECITCAVVSENILAVGSSEGYITFYDIHNLEKEPIYRADQMEYVCNIQFLRDAVNIIALSSSITNKVRFWDIKLKKLIGTKCNGKLISTSCGHSYIIMNNTLIAENALARKLFEFSLDDYDFVALAADGDKAMLWSEQGFHFTVNFHHNEGNYSQGFVEPPKERIRRYHIFKPQIAVCITEYGLLGLSVFKKKWKMYNIFALLHGIPTAVLFYVQLLILGLDSGEVHVYHVEDINCLDTLDLESMNSKKIILDTEAIISLDIMEHLTEQYLIAASSKIINIVKFT